MLSAYVSGVMQLALFAVVMLVAAGLMLRPIDLQKAGSAARANWKIAGDGLIVGVITGLVGVGGGFLIVPALVLLGGLSMHQAVATSLIVIALKSFSGFYKYLDVLEQQSLELDWKTLGIITALGIIGSVVGIITGLVGVGGGFLIVPALVLLGGLSMHQAVATSLIIIALKSYSGFWKYLDVLEQQSLELDWKTLLLVTALGIAGSVAGSRLARRLPQDKLKKWFGWFLVVMGIYILVRSGPAALGLN
jgi:hypothetical protein